MTRKNVLYLSYDGLTDPLGQSQILPYLCGLSSEFNITIASFEKPDRFATGRDSIQKQCDDNRLTWIPLKYHKSPPLLSTLYDVWRLRQTAKFLHVKSAFSIVHCRSYITSLIGIWMKRRLGVKFIFDMRGFWADERVDGGLWNLNNPVYKAVYTFFKKKETQFISSADVTVSLTENAKREILRWNLTKQIVVIPCCVDLRHFDPGRIESSRRASLTQSLNIKSDDFVLLYLGSLGTWYMTREMLEFFSALKTIKPKAHFLILTPDDVDLDNFKYKDDVIVRKVSRSEVPEYIDLANASLLFIKPTFSKKASSATKMAEILAMGVPVVTNEGWGDIDFFKGHLPGMTTVSDHANYSQALHELSAQPNAQKIREAAAGKFSLVNGIESYRKIYQALM